MIKKQMEESKKMEENKARKTVGTRMTLRTHTHTGILKNKKEKGKKEKNAEESSIYQEILKRTGTNAGASNVCHQNLKQAGITLVALVVTIVALLIIGGVSINLALNNNGIIKKIEEAKVIDVRTKASEQVKLVYMSINTKIVENRSANENYNATDEESMNILSKMIENELVGNNWNISYEETGEIRITYNDEIIENSLEYVIILEEQDSALVQIAEIDYNDKNVNTINVGDDLTIGDEKFRMAIREENLIIAIPFYNITHSTIDPIQSNSAQISLFSPRPYGKNNTDVDMEYSENNIQKYINAYSRKLSISTKGKVTARVARRNDIEKIAVPEGTLISKITICNPTSSKGYWLGTMGHFGQQLFINENGQIAGNNVYYRDFRLYGVRPLIVINTVE